MSQKNKKISDKKFTVVTHNGKFHPDELFAIAMLKKYFCEIENIIRTRDLSILSHALDSEHFILVDVGLLDNPEKLAFDHHQGTLDKFWTEERDGLSTPFSATGLVFDFLSKNGYIDIDQAGLDFIRKEWVVPIDAADNGVLHCEKLSVIFGFNREENNDEQFLKALSLVETVFENIVHQAQQYSIGVQHTFDAVRNAHIEDHDGEKRIIVESTNKNIDVKLAMTINPNIDFFIMERESGIFGIKSAPLTIDNMYSIKNKVPENFINLMDEGEKQKLNKYALNGSVDFIHKAGFFSVVTGDFNDAKEFALSIIKHS